MTAGEVDACGTEIGYGRHRRAKEAACVPCRSAHSEARRDRRYGMKPGEYAAMLERQGGRCMTCGALPTAKHPLPVDHDHETEEVRGLLCRFCNLSIGTSLESTAILRRLVLYLEGNLRTAPDHFLGDLAKKRANIDNLKEAA